MRLRKNINKKFGHRFFAIIVLLIFVIPSALPVLSSQHRQIESISIENTKSEQNMILTFGESKEEIIAINTIVENMPNINIVNYFDLERDLGSLSDYNNIFIVGHGEINGIRTETKFISYNEINGLISKSNFNDVYFVACDSLFGSQKLENARSFGFPGLVEPKLAALLVSYLSGESTVSLDDLTNQLIKVLSNPEEYSSLYYGITERKGYFQLTLLIISIALLPVMASLFNGYFVAATWAVVGSATWGVITAFSDTVITAQANNDPSLLASIIESIIGAVISVALAVVAALPWYYAAAAAGAFAADSVISGLAPYIKIALVFTALSIVSIYVIGKRNTDKADADDFFMATRFSGGGGR